MVLHFQGFSLNKYNFIDNYSKKIKLNKLKIENIRKYLVQNESKYLKNFINYGN